MRRSDRDLSETDIRSPRSRTWVVRADRRDRRGWIAGAPDSAALQQHRMLHVGVAEMASPFEIVRTHLEGSYFLACTGGEGRVLVDGRWKRCRPGQAVLLPPGTLHAFHAPPGKRWHFCWVRYQEEAGQIPLAAAQTPVIAGYEAEPLRLAILGLHGECQAQAALSAQDRWCELIHLYVLRFAQPATMDRRIWQLWQKISADLGHNWTQQEMAREVHLGEKQLQRLCRRDLGRTPHQQLIWLRMREAAQLLQRGDHKIETIARRVGYQNPFVFSTSFKRIIGCRPSEYLARKR